MPKRRENVCQRTQFVAAEVFVKVVQIDDAGRCRSSRVLPQYLPFVLCYVNPNPGVGQQVWRRVKNRTPGLGVLHAYTHLGGTGKPMHRHR